MTGRRPLTVVLAALLAVLLVGCGSAAPATDATPAGTISVVDGAGRTVEVRAPAQRVASFNLANSELVRALGAADRLVGVDSGQLEGSDAGYLTGFDQSKVIGTGQSAPNYERIAALHPDVVLFPSNGAWKEAESRLAPFGIPVLVVTGWDLPPLFDNIDLLGRVLGKPAEAQKFATFCTTQRDLVRDRVGKQPPVPVYVENQGDYKTVSKGAGWDAMVTDGGARNVFHDRVAADETASNVNNVEVDSEAVLAAKPDYVIRIIDGGYVGKSEADLRAQSAALAGRPGWNELPAVRDGHLVVTQNFWLNGCSKILGSLAVASWLHPEAMTGVDPQAVYRQYLTEFQGTKVPGTVNAVGPGR